jgi:hypothetical protein
MHSFVLKLVHFILRPLYCNVNGSFPLGLMVMGLDLNCDSAEMGTNSD